MDNLNVGIVGPRLGSQGLTSKPLKAVTGSDVTAMLPRLSLTPRT